MIYMDLAPPSGTESHLSGYTTIPNPGGFPDNGAIAVAALKMTSTDANVVPAIYANGVKLFEHGWARSIWNPFLRVDILVAPLCHPGEAQPDYYEFTAGPSYAMIYAFTDNPASFHLRWGQESGQAWPPGNFSTHYENPATLWFGAACAPYPYNYHPYITVTSPVDEFQTLTWNHHPDSAGGTGNTFSAFIATTPPTLELSATYHSEGWNPPFNMEYVPYALMGFSLIPDASNQSNQWSISDDESIRWGNFYNPPE